VSFFTVSNPCPGVDPVLTCNPSFIQLRGGSDPANEIVLNSSTPVSKYSLALIPILTPIIEKTPRFDAVHFVITEDVHHPFRIFLLFHQQMAQRQSNRTMNLPGKLL